MTLKSDAKFKEKLAPGFKYDMRVFTRPLKSLKIQACLLCYSWCCILQIEVFNSPFFRVIGRVHEYGTTGRKL